LNISISDHIIAKWIARYVIGGVFLITGDIGYSCVCFVSLIFSSILWHNL